MLKVYRSCYAHPGRRRRRGAPVRPRARPQRTRVCSRPRRRRRGGARFPAHLRVRGGHHRLEDAEGLGARRRPRVEGQALGVASLDAHGAGHASRTGSWASTKAPTTTWSSRSTSGSCWPGCVPSSAGPPTLQPPKLVVGDIEFDPSTRKVRAGPAEPLLTATELAILELLDATLAYGGPPAAPSR